MLLICYLRMLVHGVHYKIVAFDAQSHVWVIIPSHHVMKSLMTSIAFLFSCRTVSNFIAFYNYLKTKYLFQASFSHICLPNFHMLVFTHDLCVLGFGFI